ncbi:hypothetical protein ASD11_15580 [Aeromicrobium sp. Root495]|nr:hypothetical protein ASD11_15580 [Aeromicrobium sp. Root495]
MAGDWDGLVEQLSSMTAADRGATMRHLAWADQKITTPPREYTTGAGRMIAVLQAHVLVVQAWRSRGLGHAESVSEDQWRRFRELLCLAEIILIDVVAHDRTCVDAWDLRIRTARGLGLGLSESRRRYEQVGSSEPHHLPAQLDLLQELCPKWHGTWEAAFELAREASRTAPPGALQPSLLVAAHLEAWVDDGADYLRQQSVIDEVDWAAQRSVLHPDAPRGPGWLEAHSMFAQFYSLAQRPAQALTHFEVLGDAPVEALWSYFDEPARQYAIWRNTARAGGGRR